MNDVLAERRAGERRCEKVREKLAATEAKLAEALKNNDPASYSSMVYWREKCYEARGEVERLKEIANVLLDEVDKGEE